MDATLQSTFQPRFQSTNISFNQARGASINIETLQAIKQRVLQSVKQHCNVGRLGSWFTVHGSGFKVYRKELRLVRTLSRAVDGHPTLSNIGILLMGLALMVEIFLCA